MSRRPIGIALALTAVIALSACGRAPAAPDGATEPPPVWPNPACTVPASDNPCTDALQRQMDDNRAYRKRRPMPPSATAAAQPAIEQIRAALVPLARSAHPSETQLRSTLLGLGFEGQYVQTSGLAYGVEAHDGCIDGVVGKGTVTATYEGFVADGGCMVMYGH